MLKTTPISLLAWAFLDHLNQASNKRQVRCDCITAFPSKNSPGFSNVMNLFVLGVPPQGVLLCLILFFMTGNTLIIQFYLVCNQVLQVRIGLSRYYCTRKCPPVIKHDGQSPVQFEAFAMKFINISMQLAQFGNFTSPAMSDDREEYTSLYHHSIPLNPIRIPLEPH